MRTPRRTRLCSWPRNPANDWLPFQPGTINGRGGFAEAPITVQFDLRETPSGTYTLKLALLRYSPRLPWIEVAINGHRAWFYQHPKLAYSGGDQSVFYLPRLFDGSGTVRTASTFSG